MKKYTVSWSLGPLSGTAARQALTIQEALTDFLEDAITDTVVVGIRETIIRDKKEK